MGSDPQQAPMGLNDELWTDHNLAYHSQHHSPSHEYNAFNFQPIALQPVYEQPFMPPPRAIQPQLQPLVTTPWPSMLGSQSPYSSSVYHSPPIVTPPATTPVSAPASTPARTYVRERRTLTDEQRRKMCLFAEENPNVKQTEIGSMFGVERSTVSKVLRNREKYLAQDEAAQNQLKAGRKFPDIERAVANWAKNEKKNGRGVTDDQIFEQIKHFARTVVNSDHQLKGINGSWLETFKQRNGLGSKDRRSSNASETDLLQSTEICSPESIHSPLSPHGKRDAPSDDIDEIAEESHSKKLKSESPQTNVLVSNPNHRPYASISGALTQSRTTSFSADDGTELQLRFPTIDTVAEDIQVPVAQTTMTAAFRSRSQTFPAANGIDNTSYSSLPNSIGISSLPVTTVSTGQIYDQRINSSIAPEPAMYMSSTPTNDVHSAMPNLDAVFTTNDEPPPDPDSHVPPSLDETRQAITVVWNFFQVQSQDHRLNSHELAVIGGLMNKLKLQPMHYNSLLPSHQPLDSNFPVTRGITE